MDHAGAEQIALPESVITPPDPAREVGCARRGCLKRFVPSVRVLKNGRRVVQRFCHARCRSADWMDRRLSRRVSDPDQARERFTTWLASPFGRVVYAEVVRHAVLLREKGVRRYGIAAIWELIRYDSTLGRLGEVGSDYRLNNVYRSWCAREVEANEPELRGFFTKRAAMADGGAA